MVQYSPTTDRHSERLAQQLARTHSYETLNNLLSDLLASADEYVAKGPIRVLQRALSISALAGYYAAVNEAARQATEDEHAEMEQEAWQLLAENDLAISGKPVDVIDTRPRMTISDCGCPSCSAANDLSPVEDDGEVT